MTVIRNSAESLQDSFEAALSSTPLSVTVDQNEDSAGRLRVSEVTTLIDIKHLHDKQPLFIDEVVSGGTSVHSSAESRVLMSVSSNNDYVIRQTKQRFNYQSGKSHLIFVTFDNFQPITNVNKRIGYFSTSDVAPYTADRDGFFLQSTGSEVRFRVFKNGTEQVNIEQSNWDDPLDGTGPSGITIDWTKSQVFIFDFLWLGVDKIRMYTDIEGKLIPVHTEAFSNVSDGVYMGSPNQPVRYEIRSTGGSGNLSQICSSVNTEGSLNQIGKFLSYNVGNNELNANNNSSNYAAIGIRLKADQIDTLIDVISFTTLATTSDNYLIQLLLNPTVSGTFTYSDEADSSVQIAEGDTANTVTGGTLLYSSYGLGNKNGEVASARLDSAIRLGSNIDGTRDEIVLTIRPLSNGLDVYSSLNWRELT